MMSVPCTQSSSGASYACGEAIKTLFNAKPVFCTAKIIEVGKGIHLFCKLSYPEL